MTDKRNRKSAGITPDKTIAYMENKSGKSQQAIASEFGVTQQTVSSWVGEIDDFIKASPQYAEIAPRLANMIPGALSVYSDHLEKTGKPGNPDVTVATNILKMIGVFVEKHKSEHHVYTDADLFARANNLGNTDADTGTDQPDESEPKS